jgi:hypothetical protein
MDRRLVHERAPAAVGVQWAELVCERLRNQGRAVAGGWPGTLAEARGWVAGHLHRELEAHGCAPLQKGELEAAVNASYANAKSHWLAMERKERSAARAARVGE